MKKRFQATVAKRTRRNCNMPMTFSMPGFQPSSISKIEALNNCSDTGAACKTWPSWCFLDAVGKNIIKLLQNSFSAIVDFVRAVQTLEVSRLEKEKKRLAVK